MVTQSFPLVTVRGTAYEMGRQHGEQASELVKGYLALISRLTGQPGDVLARNALGAVPYIEALSPRYIEEVRGLADGAGISFGEALVCQVRTWAAQAWEDGCTAIAVRGEATADGSLLIGQNQDLEPEYGDVTIILKVEPTDGRPRALFYTFAGQLGYMGMNEHGVANYANGLFDYEWRPGVPVFAQRRSILEQSSVAECIALLQKYPTCGAGNAVLADGQGNIADVESRPEGMAIFAGQHRDAILHTNHYLTPQFERFKTGEPPDSSPRLARLAALVKQHWGHITVDVLKEIFADHAGDPGGICRHGALGSHTTSGHIAEPQKGLLHVRRGHGCLGSWNTYEV